MRAILIACAISLSAGTATAGNWSYAAHSRLTAIGIDWDTVRVTSPYRAGWIVFANYDRVGQGVTAYDYALQRVSINCDAETLAVYSVVTYRLDTPTPVTNGPSDGRYEAVVPDTLGSGILAAMCGAEPTEPGIGNASEFVQMIRDVVNDPTSDE